MGGGAARVTQGGRGCGAAGGGGGGVGRVGRGRRAAPVAAVNWNFENFYRIVFTLNFVMWVKVKPEFRAVCGARFTRLQS